MRFGSCFDILLGNVAACHRAMHDAIHAWEKCASPCALETRIGAPSSLPGAGEQRFTLNAELYSDTSLDSSAELSNTLGPPGW